MPTVGSSRSAPGGVAVLRDAGRLCHRARRLDAHETAVGALGAWLVLAVGISDGGYFGRSATAQTMVFVTIAGLGVVLLPQRRLTRAAVAAGVVLSALTAWIAVSSLWAPPGADVWFEARRALLYATALWALLVVVDAPTRGRALLTGLAAGISALAVISLALRAGSSTPVDPYYGVLLEEPVGYPNALGILMAIGALLVLGLAGGATAGRLSAAWIATGLAALLLYVLGLTGSRGAAVAVAVGLIGLVALAPAARRSTIAAMAASAVATAFVAWEIASGLQATGLALLGIGAAALVAGGFAQTLLRARIAPRWVVPAVAAVLLLLVVGAMVSPPSLTSSYRTAYWRAAVAESRDHPLLGAGAGSYWLSWQEHRTVDATVRDAHSLYVETLAELGPMSLMLVLALCAIPVVVGVRSSAELAAPATAAFLAFVVHAGLDWDWEMPVVTLAALGCAAAVLAVSSTSNSTVESHPPT